MNHPNVLSIEGVAPEIFEFCMVSRWMAHGNILDFVKKYTAANRLELVRLRRGSMIWSVLMKSQLVGVTRGLSYLHENEVIHGDLKSVIGAPSSYCLTLLG